MADSKEAAQGIMAAGMAWRVKYRKLDADGQVVRIKLPVKTLGCHRKNRGGVYASGLRCKDLCTDVLTKGFVKEEVDHAGVAVEETPIEDITQRGKDYVSGKAYNKDKSSKQQLLQTSRRTTRESVNPGTSHSHHHYPLP